MTDFCILKAGISVKSSLTPTLMNILSFQLKILSMDWIQTSLYFTFLQMKCNGFVSDNDGENSRSSITSQWVPVYLSIVCMLYQPQSLLIKGNNKSFSWHIHYF